MCAATEKGGAKFKIYIFQVVVPHSLEFKFLQYKKLVEIHGKENSI